MGNVHNNFSNNINSSSAKMNFKQKTPTSLNYLPATIIFLLVFITFLPVLVRLFINFILIFVTYLTECTIFLLVFTNLILAFIIFISLNDYTVVGETAWFWIVYFPITSGGLFDSVTKVIKVLYSSVVHWSISIVWLQLPLAVEQ